MLFHDWLHDRLNKRFHRCTFCKCSTLLNVSWCLTTEVSTSISFIDVPQQTFFFFFFPDCGDWAPWEQPAERPEEEKEDREEHTVTEGCKGQVCSCTLKCYLAFNVYCLFIDWMVGEKTHTHENSVMWKHVYVGVAAHKRKRRICCSMSSGEASSSHFQ